MAGAVPLVLSSLFGFFLAAISTSLRDHKTPGSLACVRRIERLGRAEFERMNTFTRAVKTSCLQLLLDVVESQVPGAVRFLV